jgi:hypothetical protein
MMKVPHPVTNEITGHQRDTKKDAETTLYRCLYAMEELKMKSIPISIVITFIIITSVAFADQEIRSDSSKDMCLLDIKNCTGHSYYNIVEKIARLKHAIEMGTKLYTPEECKHLEYLLEEALETAERIDADPSQVPENRDK